jgi:hypothetical protein
MNWVHRCGFCGLERTAGSATIIDPHCASCGCVIEAIAAAEAHPAAQQGAARVLRGGHAVALVMIALAVVSLVLVAVKLGYAAGGVPMAAGATTIAGLLVYVFLSPRAT